MNIPTRHIVLFLLTLVVLSACDKRPLPEPLPVLPPIDEIHQIGLNVETLQTRGAVISEPDDILSLGIFGYSTGEEDFDYTNPAHKPNLFANQEAIRTLDDESGLISPWVYDPVAFWPSDDNEKNTFFAYAPHEDMFPDGPMTVLTDEDSYGYPVIQYSVPETVSEQIDILYSEYNNDVKNINYDTNINKPGHVKYHMRHAMVWIRFIIAAAVETIDEENPTGNPDESYTILEFNFVADRLINTANFNLGTARWEIIPEIGDEGYESVFYEFDHLLDEDDNPIFTVGAGTTGALGGKETCLMMIPQNIVTNENFTSVNVLFTHDNGTTEASNAELYQTMPFPDVRLTSAGSVMTYVVKLSTKGSWIEFMGTNTIEEWLEDETNRNVEVF